MSPYCSCETGKPGSVALVLALLLASGAAGCEAMREAQARKLVVPASMPGKFMLVATGSSEQLLGQKRIHKHRRIAAADGVEIDVWVIQSRPSEGDASTRGTFVLLHPLMTSKAWFLSLGHSLSRKGWDVILPDLRAHGDSGGQYITWGGKEKYDVKAVVDALLADGTVREPIYVLGSSMGGMVAVQYAAVDPRCRGCIALGPPLSAHEVTRRMMLLDSDADHAATLALAARMAEFDPSDASAAAAAAKLRCPLIVVHGVTDLVVPYQHGKAIYDAAPQPKKLITLPDGHGIEIGRGWWLVERIEELVEMDRMRGNSASQRASQTDILSRTRSGP